MIKKFFVLLVSLPMFGAVAAQTIPSLSSLGDWKQAWSEVESLTRKESHTTAYARTLQLMQAAQASRSSRNTLAAAWYLARIAAEYQEDAADSALARYQEILPALDPVDQAVCHAFLAQFYHDYLTRNLWTINRNESTDESNPDYKLWPAERFRQAIADHLAQALALPASLQRLPVADMQPFCQADMGDLLTTPTLFDVLVNLAVECTDAPAERLRLHQQLIDYHAAGDECLRLYLDKEHLRLQQDIPNRPAPTADDCQACLDRYPGTACPYAAQLFQQAALWCQNTRDYLRALQFCDECARRFPDTPEGSLCASWAEEIRQPKADLQPIGTEIPGREMLASVTVRNADTLWFRIVKSVDLDRFDRDKAAAHLRRQPVLQAWSLVLPHRDDHQPQQHYYTLPAMPAGSYMLLASATPDFKSNGFDMQKFGVCDALLVSALPGNNALDGYLVRRSDGTPIAGQEMQLAKWDYSKKSYLPIGTQTVTGADGFYHFEFPSDINLYNIHARTVVDGVELVSNARKHNPDNPQAYLHIDILTDRPVYKPGDTLSFVVIAHRGDGLRSGHTVPGTDMNVLLQDPNWTTADSLRLTADSSGRCHGRFILSPDALPGGYRLSAKGQHEGLRSTGNKYITVEAYKQPKFFVTLAAATQVRAFGQEARFEGLAASYGEVPVSGAKVTYRVERSPMRPPWRYWFFESGSAEVVDKGTLATDREGAFSIAFIPQPDSSADLSSKPCFQYTLYVDVTDLNGETHAQQHTLSVGYQNCYLLARQPGRSDSLEAVEFSFLNLEGAPVAGEVQVTLEQLVQPQQPLLPHPHGAPGIRHTLSRQEFARRFPAYEYDYYRDGAAAHWPVGRTCLDTTVGTSADQSATRVVISQPLPSGCYRLRLAAVDPVSGLALADTAVFFYQQPDGRQCASNELFYSSVSSTRCEVGDTLRLRVGTRHRGLTLCYALTCGNRVVERRLIPLSDEMRTISIAVPRDYLGGFSVSLFSVKENVTHKAFHEIAVPCSHKELEVTFASFRDKLQPGQTETWTLRIQPKKRSAVGGQLSAVNADRSSLVLTMYDAALDSYGSLGWNFAPWSSRSAASLFDWSSPHYESRDFHRTIPYHSSRQFAPLIWVLRNGISSGGSSRRMYHAKAARFMASARGDDGMVTTDLAVVENDAAIVEEAAFVEEEAAFVERADDGYAEMRSNLNTLAFFAPDLVTDAEGNISYTFTVPDLLTRWSIRGLAFNAELQHGSLSASLITQKQLMVQPNVPRFLRQGDSISFLAKVTNLSDQPEQVTVAFEGTDAATGAPFASLTRTLTVGPGSTEPVAFPFSVPAGLFAAQYRIAAAGQHASDGEQGLIPVLTNRELVTSGLSMYLNGAGEKHVGLEPLHLGLADSSASAQPLRFALEFSANPVWYAVQALPYLQEHENPSHIYLANSIYANTLASRIVQQHPAIQSVFRQWEADTVNPLLSQLERNADIKQLLLEESPWLREGTGETERMHRIAAYFDSAALAGRLADDLSKLYGHQRADGGWSWMPGGDQSGLYITQYILERFGRLGQTSDSELDRALAFVDRETYQLYQRYLKKTSCEPVNLAYLFMRSFYPKKSFSGKSRQAYDFFYSNALNHYKEYGSLYSRAQLALVFHRHGDKRAAQDIVRRLKESALRSDELGMYWRDNTASCWWYQRPVETQAMIIQAFAEVTPGDRESVALMQQWLLKQKQTTSWCSDVATADAVTALLSGSSPLALADQPARVTVGGIVMDTPAQAGTGCQSQRWTGDSLAALRRSLRQQPEIVVRKQSDGIAWGAAYYQYFEDIDKIPSLAMGITMSKQLFVVQADGSLRQVGGATQPEVGSRVRVRLLLSADRSLEYVQVRDGRASCFEPVSTASGWRWDSGISYYMAVGSAATTFFIDRLSRGRYVIEYDLYVTNAGTFSVAPATAQCLYAPEFRATAPSPVLNCR